MCRNLFYTIDAARMRSWLNGQQERQERQEWQGRVQSGTVGIETRQIDTAPGAGDAQDAWVFLSDPQRENALCGWARGVVRHSASCSGRETAAWMPSRHMVILHTQVDAEAQANLLERGQAVRKAVESGSSRPRPVRGAERAFMDSLKPLLGVWYGRLMIMRVAGNPWLVAQVDALAWLSSSGGDASCGELLDCPPPASALWRGGDVVEMFGAEVSDLCCCSLVESPADPEVEALEADFLDALGLVLSNSREGTVVIDIDADYAELA